MREEDAVHEQILDFLNHIEVQLGYSANTLTAYRNDLGQLASFASGSAGIDDWRDFDKDAVVNYLLDLKAREYSSATVARKMAATKRFFRFLAETSVIGDDPTVLLDSPKVKKRLPRTLSLEDVAALLAAPAAGQGPKAMRDAAMLELLYATGMRVSELVALNTDDLNLASASVRCFGKGSKERIIPMDPAVPPLRRYLEAGRVTYLKDREERALFLNPRGTRLTRQGLWLIIKGYVEEIGIRVEVTPHTLRHSFATHMLDGGAGLREVQRLLGHSNVSTTQIYTQVSGERLRDAYDDAHPRA
ncbi:MAG: site-specific tyrosine recombinase XerD [Caldilineae bacterium]|nr:site-specific tyrosine recombinase XerD [Chloroflexota bacterium]MCB9176226.1 site-specific tyrosine recombinase XerD [Caldilineae bacterium]